MADFEPGLTRGGAWKRSVPRSVWLQAVRPSASTTLICTVDSVPAPTVPIPSLSASADVYLVKSFSDRVSFPHVCESRLQVELLSWEPSSASSLGEKARASTLSRPSRARWSLVGLS